MEYQDSCRHLRKFTFPELEEVGLSKLFMLISFLDWIQFSLDEPCLWFIFVNNIYTFSFSSTLCH